MAASTEMCTAVFVGDVMMLKRLLRAGADPNAQVQLHACVCAFCEPTTPLAPCPTPTPGWGACRAQLNTCPAQLCGVWGCEGVRVQAGADPDAQV